MVLYTLTNSFHGTTCRIRVSRKWAHIPQENVWDEIGGLSSEPSSSRSKALKRRVWNKLCGIKGCTCGTVR